MPCDNNTVIADDITEKIIRSVPELTSHTYLVVICPSTLQTSHDTLECLYSVHITELTILDDVIISNSKLTRRSVAALQSEFAAVSIV